MFGAKGFNSFLIPDHLPNDKDIVEAVRALWHTAKMSPMVSRVEWDRLTTQDKVACPTMSADSLWPLLNPEIEVEAQDEAQQGK